LQVQLQHPDQLFHQIWQGFDANLGALWLFSEEVSKHADQLDRARIHEFAKEMADAFGDDPQQVEQELLEFTPSLDELEICPDLRQRPDVRETMQFFQNNKFKTRVLEWAHENPQKAHKFAEVFTDYLAHPPASGILLRRSALVFLVGFLELLLENLLFGYYFYTDLDEGPNSEDHMEKARQKAEANSHNGGWRGRIQKFQELNIDIGKARIYEEELLEITQRRNLLVHKEGVIDNTYMRLAPKIYQPQGAQEGQILLIPPRYLERAFHVTTVFAFALAQACWRQWQPNKSKKKANLALERIVFTTLKEERYYLVVDLVEIGEQFSLPRNIAQIIQVNQGIAYRELGKKSDMKQIIAKISGSTRDWRISIARATLKEDFTRAKYLLIQASMKNRLVNISPYWPLFKPIKDEEWFKRIYEHPNHGELPRKR
jgi:hypothetical protein